MSIGVDPGADGPTVDVGGGGDTTVGVSDVDGRTGAAVDETRR